MLGDITPEEAWGVADEARDLAAAALEDIDRLFADVHRILLRIDQIEKAMRMLLDGHPYGAKSTLDLPTDSFGFE